jgi:GTPase
MHSVPHAFCYVCRAMTGPTPGLTRDAVTVEWSWDGRPVRLVDTAGIRR